MGKTKFNWSTDEEVVEMLKELSAADGRKPSNFLEVMVRAQHLDYKSQQALELVDEVRKKYKLDLTEKQ